MVLDMGVLLYCIGYRVQRERDRIGYARCTSGEWRPVIPHLTGALVAGY